MDYRRFYKEVYEKQDTKIDGPNGWIQWKGTSVCMDLHCQCGHHGHVDTEFFYFYRCPKCGVRYAVGQNIKLIPLTDEQIEMGEITEDRFITGSDD